VHPLRRTDLDACAAPIRSYAALYVGGMGSRDKNFYNALVTRMGYGDAAGEVQEKFLARDYEGAAAAVPFDFIDRTSLIGPVERIADRLAEFAESGVTTLTVSTYAAELDDRLATVRAMSQALERAGLAD